MAFSIYIYEKDITLYNSVKFRLNHYFPEAYIINPYDKSRKVKDVSEFAIILYDGNQYKMPSGKGSMPCEYINLYSKNESGVSVIDCSRLSLLIRSATGNIEDTSSEINPSGEMKLLLSFAYIDEREDFIKKQFNSSSSVFTLRLDLMSGIRMPSSFKTGMDSGSLTDLIRAAGSKKFLPQNILDFLNPDNMGFLTPGKPYSPDDVFDADINSVISLIKNFQELTHLSDVNKNGLIVCEGWKTADLIRFSSYCDSLHILLPSRMCDEEKGMKEFINSLKRQLTGNKDITIHYYEDYRKELTHEKAGVRP